MDLLTQQRESADELLSALKDLQDDCSVLEDETIMSEMMEAASSSGIDCALSAPLRLERNPLHSACEASPTPTRSFESIKLTVAGSR